MTDQRRIELTVLGYRIERVQELDEHGDVARQRYHVLAPGSDALLGSFAQRVEAEREIVARELRAQPRIPAW